MLWSAGVGMVGLGMDAGWVGLVYLGLAIDPSAVWGSRFVEPSLTGTACSSFRGWEDRSSYFSFPDGTSLS